MILNYEDVEKGLVDYSYWKGTDYAIDSATPGVQTTTFEKMETTKEESNHRLSLIHI